MGGGASRILRLVIAWNPNYRSNDPQDSNALHAI